MLGVVAGFWRPTFPSPTNRPEEPTLDLLLPVLANQDTQNFCSVTESRQPFPIHDWLSGHLGTE